MFRLIMIVAAMLVSAESALANGHESSSSAPPPPKQEGPPARAVVTKQGPMLVDLNGMTLYYFERDTSGNKSNCNGKCAEAWMPLAAAANATASGDFTVIIRTDGSKMWAYRYRPLYTSQADKAAGDVNGVDPAWHIARPY
jgi:predicted lipoprotein with Yx(FWY)xxD motif